LVERRPEKAGVASSILAPGTTHACKNLFPEEVYVSVGSKADLSIFLGALKCELSDLLREECPRVLLLSIDPSGRWMVGAVGIEPITQSNSTAPEHRRAALCAGCARDTSPHVGCCRATFGCWIGTIKKSATYEISSAAERRSSALRQLAENKRAAKTAAVKEQIPASFPAR
jgi:hypothetical protein